MCYRFEINAKKRAKNTAIASVVACFLVMGLAGFVVNNTSSALAVMFGELILWLAGSVMIIMIFWSLLLATKKGGWLIEVTDSVVSWQAPSGIGEQSFRIPINKVDKIVCISGREIENFDRYLLITEGHDEVELKPTHSGIDIQKFIQCLVDCGVSYERRDKA
jgi:hypothetical protein